ncbi:hypothetical protein Pr1d_33020 [Bythopirellula goksoeyrii]|uniref:Uncharacterized protein n=2 Tax=Bythopirellula goksoeyrii TaxID=1400387 RepID=A0A5B9QPU5_9BACT|nr:hypothetical protein Pr1d_33020 [Bythopirellula goksoeyrii]
MRPTESLIDFRDGPAWNMVSREALNALGPNLVLTVAAGNGCRVLPKVLAKKNHVSRIRQERVVGSTYEFAPCGW